MANQALFSQKYRLSDKSFLKFVRKINSSTRPSHNFKAGSGIPLPPTFVKTKKTKKRTTDRTFLSCGLL